MLRKTSLLLAVSALVTLAACRGRIVDTGDDDLGGDKSSTPPCGSTAGDICEGQGSSDSVSASDASTEVDANWHSTPAVTPCGDLSCIAGDICVVTRSGGGPCLMPEDGGLCPDGQPPAGMCCNRTTTVYTCEHRPSTCNDGVSCACAAQLCEECGVCQDVNAPNTIGCGCFFP
jgi:hypothetical protein